MAYAYCWRGGQIEIGARIPDGALPPIRGRRRDVERTICARSRHAYDGKTLLVPGVPEAIDDDAALSAWRQFREWIGSSKGVRPCA